MNATRAVARLAGATIASLVTLSGPAGALSQAALVPRTAAPVSRTASVAPPEALTRTAPAAVGPPAALVSGGLQLSLTRVSPAAVTPKTALVITGTARNPGTRPLADLEVRLRLHTPVLDDRQGVDDWLSDGMVNGETSSPGAVAPGADQLGTLAAGATRPFSITVPAGRLGLLGSSFGPRAIAVEAENTKAQNQDDAVLDQLRSTIVWAPGEQIDRTRLSLLVPITETTPSTQAGQPTQIVARDLAPGGRLQKLLAATSDPAISWAVDPAILASAQRMSTQGVIQQSSDDAASDNPLASPSASPSAATPAAAAGTGANAPITDAVARQQAQGWLSRFKSEQAGREVFGLPFADPDLASLLGTKQTLSLLRHSDALGQGASTSALGSTLDTTLAWPDDGKLSSAAITALGRAGWTSVVLGSANQPPNPAVDYTPSGHSALHGNGRTLTGLLYDEQLSQLVTSAGSGSQTAANTQTLLAELAAITAERPDDTRQLLAVAPRDWNPSRAGVQALISALRSSPWVSLRTIASLKKATNPPRRTPIYRASAATTQLAIGQITSALAMSRDLDTFGPALVDPEPIIEPLREQVASLLSVSWRNDRTAMSDQRGGVSSKVTKLVGGVRLLVVAKRPLFTARSAPIPLYISNTTDYPVKVVIRLQPKSGQLIIKPSPLITAPPHSQTQARIPARAISNGNVVVEGELLTSTGQVLGPSTDFTVRVRPNWESRGIVGATSVLGLLLLIGMFRSIRRRRRGRVPLESIPDVDDLATRRAAEAAQSSTGPIATQPPAEPSTAPTPAEPVAPEPAATEPETAGTTTTGGPAPAAGPGAGSSAFRPATEPTTTGRGAFGPNPGPGAFRPTTGPAARPNPAPSPASTPAPPATPPSTSPPTQPSAQPGTAKNAASSVTPAS